jgi:hypothetical protein
MNPQTKQSTYEIKNWRRIEIERWKRTGGIEISKLKNAIENVGECDFKEQNEKRN